MARHGVWFGMARLGDACIRRGCCIGSRAALQRGPAGGMPLVPLVACCCCPAGAAGPAAGSWGGAGQPHAAGGGGQALGFGAYQGAMAALGWGAGDVTYVSTGPGTPPWRWRQEAGTSQRHGMLWARAGRAGWRNGMPHGVICIPLQGRQLDLGGAAGLATKHRWGCGMQSLRGCPERPWRLRSSAHAECGWHVWHGWKVSSLPAPLPQCSITPDSPAGWCKRWVPSCRCSRTASPAAGGAAAPSRTGSRWGGAHTAHAFSPVAERKCPTASCIDVPCWRMKLPRVL